MRSPALPRLAMVAGLGAASAFGLSACVPPHHHHLHAKTPLVVGARLTCPPSQGQLTRVSVSSDGDTCEYRRGDGEQVTLTRLSLSGQTPQAALAPIETSLSALLPPRKDAETPTSKDDSSKNGDSARIDVPGVHIDAHDNKAEIRVLGVTIDADNDKAKVNAGLGSNKATVNADAAGAEVRATDIDNVNANVVLILASETPGPSGLRAVGYIARGPVSGPLVVAEFRSLDRRGANVDDDHDLRRLIELNVSR